MKKSGLIIFFVLLTGPVFCQALNDSIYNAEVHATSNSPFSDAKWQTKNIQVQKQFRKKEFPLFIKGVITGRVNLLDTLWIVERFDDECSGCPNLWADILYFDTLYTLVRKNNYLSDYNITQTLFSSHLNDSDFVKSHHEIFEVKDRIKRNKSWASDRLKYGSDNCADGTHTFLTIIPMDKKAKSIYVRCWNGQFRLGVD